MYIFCVNSDEDDDEDEDDTMALLEELERIKKERAEEKLRKVNQFTVLTKRRGHFSLGLAKASLLTLF